jgi:hypothetical protein
MDMRRKTWRQMARTNPEPGQGAPAVEIIDGVAFDYKGEPRCSVCGADDPKRQLPNGPEAKRQVDQRLVHGWTYADIVTSIEPLMEDWPKTRRISYFAIRRHQLRHLPADATATRAVVERRAIEQGLKIVVGTGPLVTRAALLELVQQRGFEAIASGEVVPSLRDTLEAAQALEELEQETGSRLTVSELAQQVATFIEVVKARMSAEEFTAVVAEVEDRLSPTSPELPSGTSAIQASIEEGGTDG